MKILPVILSIVLLSGCATVRDYDAEKVEMEQVSKIKKAQRDPFANKPTPDHVRVIEEDGVYVEVHKGFPNTGPEGIKLDIWRAIVTNTNKTAKCVSVDWALQDFEFESDLPSEFLVKAGEKLVVGKMRQTIWAFDGAYIALPPSGYAKSISVRDPDVNKKTKNQSCELDESNIDEV